MTMTILPALLLNLVTVTVHLAAIAASFALDENVWLPFASLLRSLFGGYLSFFGMGLITTLSEWAAVAHDNREKSGVSLHLSCCIC